MRILICNWKDVTHPAAGGAEVYTHQVARRWAAQGHDVTQFAAAVPGRADTELLDGVTVVRGGGRLGVYRAARAFHAASGPYDLVIDEVNTRPFGCATWPGVTAVALIHQVCKEVWLHETRLPVALAGRYVLEPRWLARLREVPVLTVSASSRDSLLEYGLRRVEVVGEGVVRRPRPPVPREADPTLIFVGRLTGSKRPEHAIEAYAHARRAVPGLRLWIVGDGPARDRLEARAPEGVSFHGRVPAARRDELMARAHALIMTSVREGWGLVVDEAAAMGTPTAAYDVAGLCDSVPAAGGALCRPDPYALGSLLAERLPGWVAHPSADGWRGGALDWDEVAGNLLTMAVHAAGATERAR